MVGISLIRAGLFERSKTPYYAVKMPVFLLAKFPGVDPILGPEMRVNRRSHGVGEVLVQAFAKALLGAGQTIPIRDALFLSVREADKMQLMSNRKRSSGIRIFDHRNARYCKTLQEFGSCLVRQ